MDIPLPNSFDFWNIAFGIAATLLVQYLRARGIPLPAPKPQPGTPAPLAWMDQLLEEIRKLIANRPPRLDQIKAEANVRKFLEDVLPATVAPAPAQPTPESPPAWALDLHRRLDAFEALTRHGPPAASAAEINREAFLRP